jgi:hypothetical protein
MKFLLAASCLLFVANVFSQDAKTGETGKRVYKYAFSQPSGWSSWKSAAASVTFSWNQNEGHKDKGAMEISIARRSAADAVFCYFKHFPATPGKTYTVSVWVKAEDITPSSEITLAFQGQDSDKKFLGTPLVSNVISGSKIGDGWKELILTFIVPQDGAWSKTAFILCTIGGKKSLKGKIFFDDLDFYEDIK